MSTEMRNRNLDALEKRFPGISKMIEERKEFKCGILMKLNIKLIQNSKSE